MSQVKSKLEISLLSDKEDIASELHSEWLSMKATFKRVELKTDADGNDDGGDSGMDVRLAVEDGCWELLTGDASFDTSQGDYCASGFLDYDWEEEEAESLCLSLAEELIESLAESECW